ncbi:hypothetical protein P691DRAFT_790575 [Macrolepiota fuliginosa MF-IS2]|uniref:Uncharacterized protein n=1 Tax=Macrolepiota fuliginosa MF-IS2 TaxID=1400762 RepID=A0A9P6C5E0_9AGAR|nr:hypothetical protein P691DRAFT_790575 [Macrolepiota fuliginosa MF-IS2]
MDYLPEWGYCVGLALVSDTNNFSNTRLYARFPELEDLLRTSPRLEDKIRVRNLITGTIPVQAGNIVLCNSKTPEPHDTVDALVRTLQESKIKDANCANVYARLLLVVPTVANRIGWTSSLNNAWQNVHILTPMPDHRSKGQPLPLLHPTLTRNDSNWCTCDSGFRYISSKIGFESMHLTQDVSVYDQSHGSWLASMTDKYWKMLAYGSDHQPGGITQNVPSNASCRLSGFGGSIAHTGMKGGPEVYVIMWWGIGV